MKRFRQLCATFLLTFMLALPATAGDISCPGAAGDPEPPDAGDPEPPDRMAGQTNFDPTITLVLALQGIFIR